MSADPFDAIIGQSRAAQAMRAFGRRAATVDAPVLLLGESGTGKGVLARAIHFASTRAARPFVGVNCAAIPETLFESEFFGHVRGAFTGAQSTHKGLFEQAHTGSLFLDEIGELAASAQAKLLTTLEDREIRRVGGERVQSVDVRIIAATARDLTAQTHAGQFRSDLFHRLSVLCFELPPLRARSGDIPLLAERLVHDLAQRYRMAPPQLAPETHARLQTHSWPGNVRELGNTMERALLLHHGSVITPAAISVLPSLLTTSSARASAISPPAVVRYSFAGSSAEEGRQIREALHACRGNKTRAAALLGMSRGTLRNKLRALPTDELCATEQL